MIDNGVTNSYTLGTSRGFSRVRWESPVLAKGRHIFGAFFRAGHYKDLTETGKRAGKVSGTQGTIVITRASYEWL